MGDMSRMYMVPSACVGLTVVGLTIVGIQQLHDIRATVVNAKSRNFVEHVLRQTQTFNKHQFSVIPTEECC